MRYLVVCPLCGKTMVPWSENKVNGIEACNECFDAHCADLQAIQNEES